jgi:putative ABC transport system permease protein
MEQAMQTLREDLTSAFRHIQHRKGAALAVILMIAVGIGANTTVFALLKATFDNPPFPEMDRLVWIRMTAPAQGDSPGWISVPEYIVLEEQNQVFEAIGGMDDSLFTQGPGDGLPAERVIGQRFKASMFRVLGIQPLLGRSFAPGEDRVGGLVPLAVISHRFWQSRFAADPHVVDRTMLLDNVRTTTVGVMPPGFSLFDDQADVWIPQTFNPAQLLGSVRFLIAVARLRPGVSLEQAQTDVDRLSLALAEKYPDRNAGWEFRLEPLDEAYFGATRQSLLLLQAAVGLILFIACANVAGLLLVQAAARHREVATRWALGADRHRLVRQLLTESLVLSLAGGALGVLLALGGVTLLTRLSPAWLARIETVAIDGPFLLFAFGVSALTGIAFGLAPSLQLSRVSGPRALYAATRARGGGRQRLQGGLVVGQVALTLVLLIGAGLVIKSVVRLQNADLGADPGGVLSFESVLSRALYLKLTGNRLNGFAEFEFSPVPAREFEQVAQRLADIPGVVSAAGIHIPPFGGLAAEVPFAIEGRAQVERDGLTAGYALVTPNYFATMRIPIRHGREFTFRDSVDAPWVAVINEAMARRFWPNEDPIGQHITLTIVPDEPPRQVVGIVGNTPVSRFDRTPMPTVYVPHVQQLARHRAPYGGGRLEMTFLMRLRGNPDAVMAAARKTVAEIDPAMPIARVHMLDEQLAEQLARPRFYMVTLAVFGGFATLLAVFGIYGVMTYSVARRTREVAIRMALGASRGAVAGLVLRQAALLTAVGITIGVVASMLVTRYLSGVLWSVTPTDPATFVGVALLFALVAMAAALVPTYRALRLEPRTVLADT